MSMVWVVGPTTVEVLKFLGCCLTQALDWRLDY